jgi:hypothetical protein
MVDQELEYGTTEELTAEMIRGQLELLVRDDVFRSSKRSVAFLRYVVEQTLKGAAEQIKERSIGIEVFGRDPSYDTNVDHIVRTAATELRKRLASYYVDEKHRTELRMGLQPGSYVPKFMLPGASRHSISEAGTEPESGTIPLETHSTHIDFGQVPLSAAAASGRKVLLGRKTWFAGIAIAALLVVGVGFGVAWLGKSSPQDLFWKPVLDTPGPVLLAVGNVPNGPPTLPEANDGGNISTPIPSPDSTGAVPFSDVITIARVTGALEAKRKTVIIRRENSSSFSDLREGAVVLIGAFNNEWSLRLTRPLRFSLALDADNHLIYIKDAKNPSSRTWSWGTNQPRNHPSGANSPKVQDFALISRIRDSGTGHVVVVIGGLYTYGTEAAGEFLTDPDLMQMVAREDQLSGAHRTLQIVLGTTVTDGTPGPPKVLAVSAE